MEITNYSVISIIIATLFPLIWTAFAKFTGRGYSNSSPRDSADKLEGKRKRAHHAHLNAFEALPLFISAVIIANINHVDIGAIHCLISINLISRALYGIFYIYDYPRLRSLVWFGAVACNIALLISALK